MLPMPSPLVLRQRLPRLVAALMAMGLGVAAMVRADVGLGPWDVLHQGISQRTGIPIGSVGILVGLVVMIAWVPLRERPGIGTLLNVIVIGATIDLVLPFLPEVEPLAGRWALSLCGIVLMGVGTGVYVGCRLGPGPRDGLMTAMAARWWSVRTIRAAMELAVLITGAALGGTVGPGTIVFALAIGPIVQWSLERLSLPPLLEPAPAL